MGLPTLTHSHLARNLLAHHPHLQSCLPRSPSRTPQSTPRSTLVASCPAALSLRPTPRSTPRSTPVASCPAALSLERNNRHAVQGTAWAVSGQRPAVTPTRLTTTGAQGVITEKVYCREISARRHCRRPGLSAWSGEDRVQIRSG